MAANTKTLALALQKDIADAKSVKDLLAIVDKYYGEKTRQCEAGLEWREGFKAIHDAENGFFNYLEKGYFDNHVIHHIAVDGNRAYVEVTTTFTLKGNPNPIAQHQLIEQVWGADGKLEVERFWHHKAK